ncbi:MAG: NAD(+) synthase [Planctomycetota bacterium]|nr:NAD(+) synthase [Planctomycetota bacterium]
MTTGTQGDVLKIDVKREIDRIAKEIAKVLGQDLKRRGLVVALSGGIDSSVVGALAVRAVGAGRVMGLLMPERDSSPETLGLSRSLAKSQGIENVVHEDITPMLDAFGCYRRRDEAVRSVVPQFGPGWKSKIVLPPVTDDDRLRIYSVIALPPEPGAQPIKARLTTEAYLGILAASNFKQRVRKTLEYYHADRLNYAVTGTPNRLEYDQGFFVKLGDGAADVKPIAHLYKTQVYALAEALGVPAEIRQRPPTTDTYSMPQSQEEFYFSLPYNLMDLCLYALNQGMTPQEATAVTGLKAEQVERVYRDIAQTRASTRYLHLRPQLVGQVPEIHT